MTMATDDALTGVVVSPRVREIIQAESDADMYEQQANDLRWQAAKLISEELKSGKSQRQLAKEIGKSHVHVQRMVKVWNLKVPRGERSFNELYNSSEVRGAKTKPEVEAPQPEPEQPKAIEPEPQPTPEVKFQEPAPESKPEPEPRPQSKPSEGIPSSDEDPWMYVLASLQTALEVGRVPRKGPYKRKLVKRLNDALGKLEEES